MEGGKFIDTGEIPGLSRSEVKLSLRPFGDEINLFSLQRIEPRFLGRAAPSLVTTLSRQTCYVAISSGFIVPPKYKVRLLRSCHKSPVLVRLKFYCVSSRQQLDAVPIC